MWASADQGPALSAPYAVCLSGDRRSVCVGSQASNLGGCQ